MNSIRRVNMDLQITTLTASSAHLELVIELGRTYYPSGHLLLKKEYLKWLYLDNPAGPATLVVAHEAEIWIGIMVLIPVILESSERLQRACYAVNVLTHPEHRGKNLFIKMIAKARDVLSSQGIWLLGHPNVNACPGWRRQKMMFRDPLQVYAAKFKWPFFGLRERRIFSLLELASLPATFWKTLTERKDVHVCYTPEFLAWRFLNVPGKSYKVVALEQGGEVFGLRITRGFKGPVDLLIDFIGPTSVCDELLLCVRRPTLVLHSGLGSGASVVARACWKLPVKRRFPFFVTTWTFTGPADMTGISLSASDF